MKIRIPKKFKFKIEKKYFKLLLGIIILSIVFLGSGFMIKKYMEKRKYEQGVRECELFTEYVNEEVLPLTTANVTDCTCTYSPQKISEEITGNCLCSCKLYYPNGTLKDADWNPLFSKV